MQRCCRKVLCPFSLPCLTCISYYILQSTDGQIKELRGLNAKSLLKKHVKGWLRLKHGSTCWILFSSTFSVPQKKLRKKNNRLEENNINSCVGYGLGLVHTIIHLFTLILRNTFSLINRNRFCLTRQNVLA